ncbi:hypothetical protein VNI00_003181 [Paramarasmius palmivorus]|uniref:Mitochondrial outer membrane transport complex Sam37/metaxin N-terminal domain-containing protein n=1 Tax=Paramarasmius palmivorus TaxID=297713 RepID=A0AAW0DPY5_9AGAR
MSPTLKLHVWPGNWNLPSLDPSCIAAVIFMQLMVPGRFSIVEAVNPDSSITGQFPYLKHENQVVAPLSSILKYVSTLPGAKQDALRDPQGGSQTAWVTYAESNLGDLVANMFYAVERNWAGLTHPTLVKHFPVPQNYYAPQRIRATYQSRLEAVGLWCLPELKEPDNKPRFREEKGAKKRDEIKPKDKFVRVFEREKVAEKARAVLEVLERLLGSDEYFGGGDRPSQLDIIVAAHILLLQIPPFPDPLIKDVLSDSFPNLASHANRIRQQALENVDIPTTTTSTWWSDDVWINRFRMGFMGITLGGIAVSLYTGRLTV